MSCHYRLLMDYSFGELHASFEFKTSSKASYGVLIRHFISFFFGGKAFHQFDLKISHICNFSLRLNYVKLLYLPQKNGIFT